MKWKSWMQSVAGTARERIGVVAATGGVVVAVGVLAFGGCRKREAAVVQAATFPAQAAIVASPPPSPSTVVSDASDETLIVYVTGAVKRPGVYTLRKNARLYHAIRAAGGFKANAVFDALNLADRARDGDQLCIPSQKTVKRAAPIPRTIFDPPIVAQRPVPVVIRKSVSPAPVVLPPVASLENSAPTVTVIATPAPGRILGVPEIVVASPVAEGIAAPIPAREQQPSNEVISLPVASSKTKRAAPKTGAKFKNPGDGVVHINNATAADLEHLPRCGPAMSAKILAYRAQIGGKFSDLKQLQDVKGVGEKTFAKWEPFLSL